VSSIDTGSSFICSRLVNVDGLLNHFVITRLSRVQWELSVDTVGNSPAYVYLHDTVYINFKVSEQVQTFQIFFYSNNYCRNSMQGSARVLPHLLKPTNTHIDCYLQCIFMLRFEHVLTDCLCFVLLNIYILILSFYNYLICC